MKFEIKLFDSQEIDEKAWGEMLTLSVQNSVFVETWFLNAITQNNWQAFVALSTNGSFLGAMPLFNTKSLAFTRSRQPILSKYWGPITPHCTNTYKNLQESKEITKALLAACDEHFTEVDYMLSPFATYPQECIWSGFNLKPMFTYYLNIENLEQLRANYTKAVRKKLRKMAGETWSFVQEANGQAVIDALNATRASGKEIMDKKNDPTLLRVAAESIKREKGCVFTLMNENQMKTCSGLILLDNTRAYFLSGYTYPEFRQDGVMNKWLDSVFEALQHRVIEFDFFGSSIESIETFFRSFGANSRTYFRMSKSGFPFNLR